MSKCIELVLFSSANQFLDQPATWAYSHAIIGNNSVTASFWRPVSYSTPVPIGYLPRRMSPSLDRQSLSRSLSSTSFRLTVKLNSPGQAARRKRTHFARSCGTRRNFIPTLSPRAPTLCPVIVHVKATWNLYFARRYTRRRCSPPCSEDEERDKWKRETLHSSGGCSSLSRRRQYFPCLSNL